MGKQGPCCHCGVTSTPLWRNGPPNKPVLCNACGSRWRTKGSLTNYTPSHTRDSTFSEECKVPKVRRIFFKPKEKNEHDSSPNFPKVNETYTSHRSSSGSAISCSESCAHFGSNEAGDMTGSVQSNVSEPLVLSKKRTRQKPSPIEKLREDLYSIWCEQQSSNLSSTEDDLLCEGLIPTGSFEIGNGSILLRYSNSESVDEESEASSLPRDNKSCMTFETCREPVSYLSKREKASSATMHIPCDIDSTLSFTDLKDVNSKHNTQQKRAATENVLERSRSIQNQQLSDWS